jgi:antibiotic biosynthesis monooxygenase (ABM) superfamily enzyme
MRAMQKLIHGSYARILDGPLKYPLISPLAIVLIGGLISSTLLSRIVTPVVYKLLPPKIEGQEAPQRLEMAVVAG